MREILFRGRRKDNGEWVEGDLHKNIDFSKAHIHPSGERVRSYDVIPETVGQYTGLTDKNGRKIFEGDIVTMPAYAGGRHKSDVYFKNGKFAVDGSNYHFKDIAPKRMEVIGNIHDNPELLKGEQKCCGKNL